MPPSAQWQSAHVISFINAGSNSSGSLFFISNLILLASAAAAAGVLLFPPCSPPLSRTPNSGNGGSRREVEEAITLAGVHRRRLALLLAVGQAEAISGDADGKFLQQSDPFPVHADVLAGEDKLARGDPPTQRPLKLIGGGEDTARFEPLLNRKLFREFDRFGEKGRYGEVEADAVAGPLVAPESFSWSGAGEAGPSSGQTGKGGGKGGHLEAVVRAAAAPGHLFRLKAGDGPLFDVWVTCLAEASRAVLFEGRWPLEGEEVAAEDGRAVEAVGAGGGSRTSCLVQRGVGSGNSRSIGIGMGSLRWMWSSGGAWQAGGPFRARWSGVSRWAWVEHLLDGPLEVLLLLLLLKRLPGERISEEEALAAVEVLQATDGLVVHLHTSIGDAEEVIDLEGDDGQVWPGGHRSADQGRLADGGGAAGQQLHIAARLHQVVAVRLGARVALQKGVPDVLDALLAVSLAVVARPLDVAQTVRPVAVVQSQVGEVGEEGGEGGHLIGTGKWWWGKEIAANSETDDRSLPVEEGALHQVQSGERGKADAKRFSGHHCHRRRRRICHRRSQADGLCLAASVVVPGDAKLLQAAIVVLLPFSGGGGQWDDQLLHQLGQRRGGALHRETAEGGAHHHRLPLCGGQTTEETGGDGGGGPPDRVLAAARSEGQLAKGGKGRVVLAAAAARALLGGQANDGKARGVYGGHLGEVDLRQQLAAVVVVVAAVLAGHPTPIARYDGQSAKGGRLVRCERLGEQLGQLISATVSATTASCDLFLLLLTASASAAPGIDHGGDRFVVTFQCELVQLQTGDGLEFGADGRVGGFLQKGRVVRIVEKSKVSLVFLPPNRRPASGDSGRD
ncbi:hypothetical protein TYRP_020925 [Tyrophagus putrescentiae]|nr:hypothetical protein TYRP_020925 [Tyrophagus putrescentiae]